MRIALVGGSELMAWIVAEVSPPDVEIQHLRRFAAARETLETHPPDAVLFAVTPQRPPWDELADLCAENQPPIPSAVYFSGESGPVGRDRCETVDRRDLVVTPGQDELRDRIRTLRDAARRYAGGTPGDG